MDDLDILRVEIINSSLTIRFRRVGMDNSISRSVRTGRLLGMDPRIGGNVILEQVFTISIMQRFLLMLASLVNSWLWLALKKMLENDNGSGMEQFL